MNAVPRSIAQNVGKKFLESIDGNQEMANVRSAREFLRDLDKREWETLRPETSHLNGSEYKKIWELLSGEGNGIQWSNTFRSHLLLAGILLASALIGLTLPRISRMDLAKEGAVVWESCRDGISRVRVNVHLCGVN